MSTDPRTHTDDIPDEPYTPTDGEVRTVAEPDGRERIARKVAEILTDPTPDPTATPYTPTDDEVRSDLARLLIDLIGRTVATGGGGQLPSERIADLFLASEWLADHDARVKAEALRGAADDAEIRYAPSGARASRVLNARADRIAAGEPS